MALLRVFDVPPTPAGAKQAPPPVERAEKISLNHDGDAAKREARELLEHGGSVVRTMNWGPNERGVTELIAYVTKKEGL